MNVIVLCAGYATRMYPLTRDVPKPLLEVGDRAVLSHLMDRVLAIDGLRHGILVTNHKFADRFRDWLKHYEPPIPFEVVDDGSTCEDDRLGALRDLALGWDALPAAARGEDTIVVGGDNLIDFDLRGPAARFRASGQPLLLARRIEGTVPPNRYSEVVLDQDDVVTRFREKPPDPRSDLSCICLYMFTADVRDRLANYLDGGGNPDAPGHFLAWLTERCEIRAARIEGPWFDIGSIETLEEARRLWERET